MATLGSIYDDDGPAGPRGRDLCATVSIPRSGLGAGCVVRVPLQLPHGEGELVSRAIGPGERGPTITLNLPNDVPNTVRLRLRGQGEAVEDGRPGDLHLEVIIVEEQATTRWRALGWGVAAATLLVLAGLAAWLAT